MSTEEAKTEESLTIQAVRAVSKLAVGFGTSKIVADIIKYNTRVPLTKFDKITMLAGSFAIGGVVSSVAEKYVDEQIDSALRVIRVIRKQAKPEDL